jgi:uncharacterized protein (TIGR00304 family)
MVSKTAAILFALGVICIAAGIALGEGKAGIFIIFPFIYGNGLLMMLGIILIFISFPLFMFSRFRFEEEVFSGEEAIAPGEIKTEKHAGGLILIGPIPIIISSDWKTALILISVAIAIITALLILSFLQL